MSVPFFDIKRQNDALRKEIDSTIAACIDRGQFILGDNVSLLEKEIASYCGVKHAIGVASGTDALHLALRASGLKPGDEVITTPFTFVATAEAISYCGAVPVFVDIEPNTFNINPDKIIKSITRKTKAMLPVHLYGQPCEMDKIVSIATDHNLAIIEDCAQAIGAEYKGKKVGSFGLAGCFSFFPTKNLGCFGDGGMITTNNDDLAHEILCLRSHGSRKTYHYDIIGYNSRLDELQAAILRLKLKHLEEYASARIKNTHIYRKLLKNLDGFVLPHEIHGVRHVFNQFTVRVKDRNSIFEFLKVKDVGRMVYYPLSLHLQKAFSHLGYKPGALPDCESAQEDVLSLPIFPELQSREIEEACHAILEFYRK